MAVDVAVAGVISVGHGHDHDHDHDDDNVHDHPSSRQLGGASVMERRLFLPSAFDRDFFSAFRVDFAPRNWCKVLWFQILRAEPG